MDRRIASLDGFRALSISLVIFAHLFAHRHIPVLWRLDVGKLGVQVFFVISGFLISTLLLAEQNRTGTISLRGFYLRRAFRIMPAFYVFIAAMALLIPTGYLLAHYRDLLPAGLYYADYVFANQTLGHTWSLAVEEQFYLLWPGVLVLLGTRRSLRTCLILIALAPAFRIAEGALNLQTYPFEGVCDSLAVGCVLALMRERLWENARYRAVVSSRYLLCAPVIIVSAMAAVPDSRIGQSICICALNFAIVMILDRYMRFPRRDIGVLLNSAPMVWIGMLSYSLYLWQQPFMANTRMLQIPWFVKVGGAIACAALSFYLVERPMLSLRQRLRRPSSATGALLPTPPSV